MKRSQKLIFVMICMMFFCMISLPLQAEETNIANGEEIEQKDIDYQGEKELTVTYKEGQRLGDLNEKLEEGFAFVNAEEMVGNVNETSYECAINYSDKEKAKNYKDYIVKVKVEQAEIDYQGEKELTVTYKEGQRLGNLNGKLEKGFAFVNAEKLVGNVNGTSYECAVNYSDKEKAKNYKDYMIKVKVTKARITDYKGGKITATRGQTLKDIKLPKGFAFVKSLTTSVGKVGTNNFQINYSGAKSSNYENLTVKIEVKLSKGDMVAADINSLDVSAANLTMDKIKEVNRISRNYDTLSSKEKKEISVSVKNKLSAAKKVIQNCKCGTNVYYRYSNGNLTIFGKGAMKDLIDKFNTKTIKKSAEKRSYQAYAGKTTKVVVEDGVSKVGRGAFAYFTKLKTIQIKGNKTKVVIGKGAFYYCRKLTSVSLKGITTIEFAGFCRCSEIKKITLPEGLKKLDQSAFFQCTNLKQIALPSTLKKVGGYCFFDCKKLKKIIVKGKITKCGSDVFYNVKKAKIICSVKKANKCNFVKKAKKAGLKIKKK